MLEPFEVDGETWRELIEDRAKMPTEMPGVVEKPCNGLFRLLELFQVRQEPAGLHCVNEVRRRLFTPGVERLRFRESIETVVDLDRIERQRIVAEPPRL